MNIINDKVKWNSLFEGEFRKYEDVYFRYEYNELYQNHYDVTFKGILWEDDNLSIFWEHLIRDISKIEQFKDFKYFDLTTAYGYGGPLIVVKTGNNEEIVSSLKIFFSDYERYAIESGYVCEFVRFHPLFENWNFLDQDFELEYRNDVVAVDLTRNLKDLWKNITKGQRYNIKKSIKEGCEAEIIKNPSNSDIETFLNIYNKAMDKNIASDQYYFSKEFIRDTFNLLNSIMIKITYKNEIVGMNIFINGTKIIHYHLSGATFDFKGIYPSAMALWEAIKWSKEEGFECLHLGGGRGKNDSLFKFKRSFSEVTYPFHIGKKIFDSAVYEKLLTFSSMTDESTEYFPAYRYGHQDRIV